MTETRRVDDTAKPESDAQSLASAKRSESDAQSVNPVSVGGSTAPSFGRDRKQRIAYGGVLISLVVMAIVSPVIVFVYLREAETARLEKEFKALASAAKVSFGRKIASMINTVEGASMGVTSFALDSNATWPFILLPYFDFESLSGVALPQSLTLSFGPLVTSETREAWEKFTADNVGWHTQAIERQANFKTRRNLKEDSIEMSHLMRDLQNKDGEYEKVPAAKKDGMLVNIYHIDPETGVRVVAPPNDIFVPAWQTQPLGKRGKNYDFLSPGYSEAPKAALSSGRYTITGTLFFIGPSRQQEANQFSFYLQQSTGDPNITYNGEATGAIYFPVFDTFEESKQVTGIILSSFFWPFLFDDIFADTTAPIYIAVHSECSESFTMLIKGKKALQMGLGSLHNTAYDDFIFQTDTVDALKESGLDYEGQLSSFNEEYCPQQLHMYPTDELYHKHVTAQPIIAAALVSLAFVFMVLTLVSYDLVLKRRLSNIERVAKENGALVYELYPAPVRERLVERMRKSRPRLRRESRPRRFSKFLFDSKAFRVDKLPVVTESPLDEKPIADSFAECTILFSYLDGFDEWSTERTPVEIFMLLERIFGCMDSVARIYGVFKINTIFDSYFAATGLPKPRSDHASRMAKFARESMGAIKHLLDTELTARFGESTSTMQLQIGIHSGRVTAGILAGDKVRFDVFGDCVNTASRMASNSVPGSIHLSPDSADELMKMGKSKWLTRREDEVILKGKGRMSTYWLRVPEWKRNPIFLTPPSSNFSSGVRLHTALTPIERRVSLSGDTSSMEFLAANRHLLEDDPISPTAHNIRIVECLEEDD